MIPRSRAYLLGLAMVAVALVGFVPTTQAQTDRPSASEAFLELLHISQSEAILASLVQQGNVTTTRLNGLEQLPVKTPPVVQQINQPQQQQAGLERQLNRQLVALQSRQALANRLAALGRNVQRNQNQARTLQVQENRLSSTMTAIANQIARSERVAGTPVR